MLNRIKTFMLSIILIVAGSLSCSPAYGTQVISERDVLLIQCSEYKGGVFYEKIASWQLEITNSASNELSAEMTAVIKDLTGNTVWSDTRALCIGPKTKKAFGISAELSDYGIYTIDVTLNGSFGEIRRTEKFSCTKKSMAVNDFMGTQNHFVWETRDYPEANLPSITASGFGVVRDHIEWYQVDVNSENGIPARVIDFVDKIHASGQKLILAIGNSNPAYDNGGLPVSDDALKAYGEFCGYVAERLKGKVYAYEIWNEPDYFDAFTNGIANTGTEYCKVLKTAYEAIDAVDKEALILGGSLTAIGYTSLGLDNAALDYMQEMLGAGASKYMDAFSFHPYANTGYYFDENVQESRNPAKQLELARNTLDSYGATDTPIWITEVGTSSYIDNEGTDEGYTELEQAINLQRMVMIAKAEKSVMGMSIYNYREKGNSTDDMEQNFGIINNDYTAKPAFVGISFLNDLLIDAEYIENSVDGTLSEYRFKDKCDGSDIFALWTKGGGEKIVTVTEKNVDAPSVDGNTFSYPEDYVLSVFDMYGNSVSGQSITIGKQPVYIKCTPKNVTPTICFNEGKLRISGKINNDNGLATIVIYKNLLDAKEIVGIKQIKAERSKGYTAEFDLDTNTIYGVCVYDGEAYNDFVNGSVYDIGIELYRGNEKLDSLEEIIDGEEITAVVRTVGASGTNEKLSFFGVIYGEDRTLAAADKQDVIWEQNGKGEASATVKIESRRDLKEFKLMLWDGNLRPIINPITLR